MIDDDRYGNGLFWRARVSPALAFAIGDRDVWNAIRLFVKVKPEDRNCCSEMIVANINDLTGPAFVAAKARAYWELLKFRLSFLVAFSCAFGYVLASSQVNWITLAMLFLGGFLWSSTSLS